MNDGIPNWRDKVGALLARFEPRYDESRRMFLRGATAMAGQAISPVKGAALLEPFLAGAPLSDALVQEAAGVLYRHGSWWLSDYDLDGCGEPFYEEAKALKEMLALAKEQLEKEGALHFDEPQEKALLQRFVQLDSETRNAMVEQSLQQIERYEMVMRKAVSVLQQAGEEAGKKALDAIDARVLAQVRARGIEHFMKAEQVQGAAGGFVRSLVNPQWSDNWYRAVLNDEWGLKPFNPFGGELPETMFGEFSTKMNLAREAAGLTGELPQAARELLKNDRFFEVSETNIAEDESKVQRLRERLEEREAAERDAGNIVSQITALGGGVCDAPAGGWKRFIEAEKATRESETEATRR